MFEYKEASFYTSYFYGLKEFKLIDEFKKSEDKEEENLYVGMVEVLNTIHPLVLRVEIPFSFPHMKLTFRTKSISGYPHLIHNGKIKYGDWFCLNTPFAETAEEQLNFEVYRLKEWIKHQMRNDLPTIIEDANVKKALAFANAYEWENLDEVKEFSSQAMLTFVGDFHNSSEYFKEKLGHIHCVKTPDKRFYALSDKSLTNYELPYIIVEEAPKSSEVFHDFIQLKNQYGWDEKICEHLLPGFSLGQEWKKVSTSIRETLGEEEALNLLQQVEEELSKETSYLDVQIGRRGDKVPTMVLPVPKNILFEDIKKIKESVVREHEYNPWGSFRMDDYDNMTEEEIEEQNYNEYYATEVYPYEWHHFAFGIKCEDNIQWFILYTNHFARKYDEYCFDIKITQVNIGKVIAQPLEICLVQEITEDMYFGRGAFSPNIKEKKIALVGLGAIGSMVAESMAHSGISRLGLWDNDIVEPGNICRSSYSLKDLGNSKVKAITEKIKSINPFVNTNSLYLHGIWHEYNVNYIQFEEGSFYGNVNYNDQEKAIKEIEGYDLIIDCTASNEMLHFLSYAVPQADILSLCITNHANELLCVSSRDGNPFEQRKAYLSRIEQDTKNFYIEGDGCYSPTFLATNSDIASLVNLALRELNKNMKKGELMHSTIFSHTDRGVVADRIVTYKLEDYDIILNVPTETLLDAEEMADVEEGQIGYIFGSYSRNGKQIMVTHIIDAFSAKEKLEDTFQTSKGIIDYIGDYDYSESNSATYRTSSFRLIAAKAVDPDINTNNPLLAIRNTDNSVSFFLYINNELVPFIKKD